MTVSGSEANHWPTMRAGSNVTVVAPAGPFDLGGFERGLSALRRRYRVRVSDDIYTRSGYFAGDDSRRIREFNDALSDTDCEAIIAARGGYGCARILPHLNFSQLRTHPKLLIGFSDITALHAQWYRMGIGSLHGTMVASLGNASSEQRARLFEAMEGRLPDAFAGLTCIAGGHAEGALFGGNLAVLSSLLGTPYAPDFDDGVLFIEDVGERPYRVDRLLTTLHLGGYLGRLAAVIVGAFTSGDPGADGVHVADVIQERLGSLHCPVVSGMPCGHIHNNCPLPLGARVAVDGNQGRVELL